MDYGDFKDLNRRIFADNVLRNKAFDIAKDPKYDGYQWVLASMVYKFFDKKKSSAGGVQNENISNKELAEEYKNYMLLTFIANMLGLFFLKIKKVFQVLMLFQNF